MAEPNGAQKRTISDIVILAAIGVVTGTGTNIGFRAVDSSPESAAKIANELSVIGANAATVARSVSNEIDNKLNRLEVRLSERSEAVRDDCRERISDVIGRLSEAEVQQDLVQTKIAVLEIQSGYAKQWQHNIDLLLPITDHKDHRDYKDYKGE